MFHATLFNTMCPLVSTGLISPRVPRCFVRLPQSSYLDRRSFVGAALCALIVAVCSAMRIRRIYSLNVFTFQDFYLKLIFNIKSLQSDYYIEYYSYLCNEDKGKQ